MEYFVDRNFVTESKVSSRSMLTKIDAVYDALDDEHKELFLNLCFGKLYTVRSMQISLKLIHNLLIRRVRSENTDELWFCLGNKQDAQFSFLEFTLVTGFKRCDETEYKNRILQNGRLFDKYFGDGDKITPSHLYDAFDNEEEDMNDKYKLGLACIYESVLRAKELNTKIDGHILDLVDYLDLFNEYPWGRKIYDLTRYAFTRSWEYQKERYSLWGFPIGGAEEKIQSLMHTFMRMESTVLLEMNNLMIYSNKYARTPYALQLHKMSMRLVNHPPLQHLVHLYGGAVRVVNTEIY
ncbi:Ubiquitin-like protease domain-containing protein [Abeliophyllum distichum]|uniref:Ubiquitin-like protease domain-containing protein n=1 Tax=Abeliophyllum distichum TaxID=126358 RepID=A0ABD1PE16_9LAMI